MRRAALTAVLSFLPAIALADPPKVATSILPIHSITASVMEGAGEPTLLVPPGASPHTYAMRPSEARALNEAELVIWVGPSISTFLVKPLETLAGDASILTLSEAKGLHLLPVREGGEFDAHDHDHGHGHDDHDDHDKHDDHGHGHDDHDDHDKHDDHDDHAKHDDHDDHDHKDHDDHAKHDDHDDHGDKDHDDHAKHDDHDHDAERPEEPDLHIWLETGNAAVMAEAIADRLSELDPENAATYHKNAHEFADRMDALGHELEHRLEPAAGKPFIVFHDAWQHFEEQFGLTAVGSVTLNPETPPGAAHISNLRHKMEETGAVCVFSEPQFGDALVRMLTSDSPAGRAEADPLGSRKATPGIGYYEASMKEAADAFLECLAG